MTPLVACVILVLDFLTDLQLGFKRKSSEGVGDSSIDMSVGNASRRLKVLKIVLRIVTTNGMWRRRIGHVKLEG
jgi:hypothetical protein